MTLYAWLMAAPLIGLLVWAAVVDLRTRRIPNWLTFSVVISGISQSFIAGPGGAMVTPGRAMLGLLVGFALPLVMFALGALGGGDVKLLAGVGAWLGPMGSLKVFALAAIVGLVIVLTQSVVQRRTKRLFRNSAVLAINLVHLNEVGVEHASQTGKSSRSVDRLLPYAVPILAATVGVLIWGR
jgi:prepilin peptidase CpaA